MLHYRVVPLHPLVEEWDADLTGGDPLAFPGYTPPSRESVLTGRTAHYALVEGRFDVLGGSMGAVHGERVARAYRRAADEGLPVVVRPASGGARMQEGMVALVQMARTATAASVHRRNGLLSLAVLGHPTTGGVFASYASVADVRAAVRGATVGFAGPRVVEQLLGVPLPAGSHTAEGAFAAGLVDAVVDADDGEVAWVEAALGLRDVPLVVAPVEQRRGPDVADEPVVTAHGVWGEVLRARDPRRPSGLDVAAALTTSWTPLRSPDPTVHVALATFEGRRVVVIANDRHALPGRPGPAGYEAACRGIELAGRIGLPVLTFVDTPGAEPGPAAEAAGIGPAIARTFAAMADLPTPSVAVCVGEGGSGGALALAFADRLLLQEHAVFSVIGPEGAAAILHRDAGRAAEVAPLLRLTSRDLLDLGIVDSIVPEDRGADDVRDGVRAALRDATPGDRLRRFDAATVRWLS